MHKSSLINAILLSGFTSMQSLPIERENKMEDDGQHMKHEFTHSIDRTGFLAFLLAFLGFAAILRDDGNTGKFVAHNVA